MPRIKNKLTQFLPLPIWILSCVFFALAIFSRFYLINDLPFTIQYDELVYNLNAKSAALSGTDLTGDQNWQAFSFTPVEPLYAELTSTLILPFHLLFPNASLNLIGHLPFILCSLILPFLIAGLAFRLTKSRSVSWFAWFIALFNPWLWQVGRLGFDSYFSLFFFTLGAFLWLKLPRWHQLWSLPAFIIGFYQYQGYKAILPFLIAILLVYQLWPALATFFSARQKNFRRLLHAALPSLIIAFFCLCLTCFYFFYQLPNQSNQLRRQEILTPFSAEIEEQTLTQKTQFFSTPFDVLINNKYVIWGQNLLQRYFEVYNPVRLFWRSAEAASFYNLDNYGIFHLLDLALILIGFYALIKKRNFRLLTFFGLFLLIAPLPALLSTSHWFYFRGSFLIVPLVIIAGLGADQLRRFAPAWLKVTLITTYSLSIAYFGYLYFFRLPLQATRDPYYADHALSHYLNLLPPERTVTIYSPHSQLVYLHYLFYQNQLTSDNIDEIKTNYQHPPFQHRNLTFTGDCLDLEKALTSSDLVITAFDHGGCPQLETTSIEQQYRQLPAGFLSIKRPTDDGKRYFIAGDYFCHQSGAPLTRHSHFEKLTNLRLNRLSATDFCQYHIHLAD